MANKDDDKPGDKKLFELSNKKEFNPTLAQLSINLEKMKAEFNQFNEVQLMLAKYRFAAYKQHIDAGFSKEEALEIVKGLFT